jgi:transposase
MVEGMLWVVRTGSSWRALPERFGPRRQRRPAALSAGGKRASGRNPLDVQRQMEHTTLTMTNYYASLTVDQLRKSHERYSPLKGEESSFEEENDIGRGYWSE